MMSLATPEIDEETVMSETASPDDLLLLPEIAQMTRKSEATLRWLRHHGKGPLMWKMGTRLVARRGVVAEWIAQQEREQIGDKAAVG
jgi:predicted DNA-binding transcriptional regulator AlpA